MSNFLMPKLGADMTEGKLVVWRKRVSDAVHRGDIVAEVDTDKGVIEIESFTEGIVESLIAQPGDIVPVGSTLAIFKSTDDQPDASTTSDNASTDGTATATTTTQAAAAAVTQSGAPQPTAATNQPPASATSATSTAPAAGRSERDRPRISPAARALASRLGVDIDAVRGSGPEGAITREDIERAPRPTAAQAAAKLTAAETTSEPRAAPTDGAASTDGVAATAGVSSAEGAPSADRNARMRSAIAAAMARSNRDIPHYYLSTTIDLKNALDWLTLQNEQRPVTDRLLYGVLLLKATALALRGVPELNAFWEDGRLQPQASIHLGVAIALRGGGLIAPAIHDADRKSLDQLMADLRDLVQRTRSGGLRSSELSEQTITVTSLGERGVESVFGVIYPPQVALIGLGKISDRPWCVEGRVVPRPLLTATLAGDHRATDGHRGGIFLTELDRLLQEPDKL